MWIKNIQHQTLLLIVSLTLGVALVFSALAAVTAFVVEDAVLSSFLGQQANQIEQHYLQHNELPSLPFSFLEVFTSINEMPIWAQQHVNPNRLYGEIFTPDATHYHYRKLILGEDRNAYLLAEVSTLLVVTHQPHLVILFLAVFFIAIAFASCLAVKFSQKIVNPILALTTAVKLNEQPTTSTPLPQLKFELGYLADAMQGSFDKLNQLLAQEKAFATDVSHELRTPLTVLKNSCALIAQRGFTSADLAEIKNAIERMEHIVDVLLALARTELLAMQPCNILINLEQAILQCHAKDLEDFKIHLNIPQDLTLCANSKLLQLIFINLLRNAAEHASEPMLFITAVNGQLVFNNKAETPTDFNPADAGVKSNNSSGVGQGLYLVSRITEHFGWQLTINSSNQHFCVIINSA